MRPVFIGDEVTAAAYRLAGVDVRVGPVDQAAVLWAKALNDAPSLILITGEYAAELPPAELDAVLARLDPPVAIVPDVGGQVPMPDFMARVRASLGIAA